MTMQTDPYYSRAERKPRIIDRQDPVIYSELGHRGYGPLSVAQLASYETQGFLFCEQVFAQEEVHYFREELTRLRTAATVQRCPEVVLEPAGNEIRSVFAVHQTNPVFRRLSRDKRLVTIASQLLGSPVYIHQSRINYKPGFSGKEFYWHSDFETWHMEDGMPRMRAVSCSIALSENNEFNGPLLLIPGSHKSYVLCVGKTPDNHYLSSLRKQEYGVPDSQSLTYLVERGGIAAPKGAAGSVVFFECNMMHGSNSNITPWPRHNVFIVYNSVANALVEPFCGLTPRPEFIAGRNFTPIEPES
ncbi:MAG: ectoine hydroxylase [Candidatus Binatia bacterium]